MAYVDKEKKQKIAAALRKALEGYKKEYKLKYTVAVRHHSIIVITIWHSKIDFGVNGDAQVNEFYLKENYEGVALEVLERIRECANIDNYDKSDPMTDYFHVGHYVDINIGKYGKPYQLIPVSE